MSAEQIADQADMIVAGYAYRLHEDYVEVIDLNNTDKKDYRRDSPLPGGVHVRKTAPVRFTEAA